MNALFADDNEFITEAASDTTAGNASLLYHYDADDIFTDSSGVITMEKFEELLDTDGVEVVDIVVYNPNGESIFQVQ